MRYNNRHSHKADKEQAAYDAVMRDTRQAKFRASDLVHRAKAAGLMVKQDGNRTEISRSGPGACAIHVYENGTIVRADVRLDLAARLPAWQAANLLGI